MDRQAFIAQVHEDLARDPMLLHACDAVVKNFTELPANSLQHISFGMISRAAGLTTPYEALPVAQYLSSSRAKFLQRCYLLIVGDDEYEIDDETAEEAFKSNVLYHPDLGEAVPDFENLLHIYFVIGENGKSIQQRGGL